VRPDFACGDEVDGSCTGLRRFPEAHGQACVLRAAFSFPLALPSGVTLTCKQAAVRPGSGRGREIRCAGKGSKGERWYARAWPGTAPPRHHLLIRRQPATGELAFHYCYLLPGQQASLNLPTRAAGCAGPPGRTSSSARAASARTNPGSVSTPRSPGTPCRSWPPPARCAVTATLPRHRTDIQAPAPAHPDQAPPPPGSTGHRLNWRRRHQARSRWYHQRTRSPATPRSPWSASEWRCRQGRGRPAARAARTCAARHPAGRGGHRHRVRADPLIRDNEIIVRDLPGSRRSWPTRSTTG
jgi:hypothetical protein